MQEVEAADSAFELASVFIAKAGWEFRRAAYLCRDSRLGISTDQAVKACPPIHLMLGEGREESTAVSSMRFMLL